MRLTRAVVVLLPVLVLVACGDEDPSPPREAASELASLTLRPGEAPEGLALVEDAGGNIGAVRDVLPPATDAPQLPPLPKEVRTGFREGYESVYRRGTSAELVDVTSSALRFSDGELAATFLAYLRQVQDEAITVGTSELLDTPGLGEEGYGWHRTVPGAETSGCSWRRGDLVFTLTVGGPLGQAPAAGTVELAKAIDARLP